MMRTDSKFKMVFYILVSFETEINCQRNSRGISHAFQTDMFRQPLHENDGVIRFKSLSKDVLQ